MFFVMQDATSSDDVAIQLEAIYNARFQDPALDDTQLVAAFGENWRNRIQLFAIDPATYHNSTCKSWNLITQIWCTLAASYTNSSTAPLFVSPLLTRIQSTGTSVVEETHILPNANELAVPARRCEPCLIPEDDGSQSLGVFVESPTRGDGVYECDTTYAPDACDDASSQACADLLSACNIPDPEFVPDDALETTTAL